MAPRRPPRRFRHCPTSPVYAYVCRKARRRPPRPPPRWPHLSRRRLGRQWRLPRPRPLQPVWPSGHGADAATAGLPLVFAAAAGIGHLSTANGADGPQPGSPATGRRSIRSTEQLRESDFSSRSPLILFSARTVPLPIAFAYFPSPVECLRTSGNMRQGTRLAGKRSRFSASLQGPQIRDQVRHLRRRKTGPGQVSLLHAVEHGRPVLPQH